MMDLDPLTALAGAGATGWPLALTMAAVVARDHHRRRRHRRSLNERLHELRRPLQALVLSHRPAASPDPLELALAALRDLDADINGGAPELRRRPVDARGLLNSAAGRWRARAAAAGRAISVRWDCGVASADADPVRVSQALDNLIANALEHGRGTIVLRGARRGSRIELSVRDGGRRSSSRPLRARDPRHGHGLRVVRAVAERHGGSVRVRPGERGTVAALELPLTAEAPAAHRHG